MLYMAAATFHTNGFTNISDIRDAYHTLTPLLGPLASIVFGISLLASGISSSAVGTMAGQVIMDGFVGFSTPLWIRRLVTMVPAIVIIYLGLPTTQTLVVSQVVLSLVLPFAVLPLVWFTARRSIMGGLVNMKITTAFATLASIVIVALNILLLVITFRGGV
jgi:manganese transport protein